MKVDEKNEEEGLKTSQSKGEAKGRTELAVRVRLRGKLSIPTVLKM